MFYTLCHQVHPLKHAAKRSIRAIIYKMASMEDVKRNPETPNIDNRSRTTRKWA